MSEINITTTQSIESGLFFSIMIQINLLLYRAIFYQTENRYFNWSDTWPRRFLPPEFKNFHIIIISYKTDIRQLELTNTALICCSTRQLKSLPPLLTSNIHHDTSYKTESRQLQFPWQQFVSCISRDKTSTWESVTLGSGRVLTELNVFLQDSLRK